MSERIGPETKAMIRAIDGLKQSMYPLKYGVTTIDLTAARVDELFSLPGEFDYLAVISMNGNDASIKLDATTNSVLDLMLIRTFNTVFKQFYLTNTAQPGKKLVLGLGGDASFTVQPVITNTVRVTEGIEARPVSSRQRTGRAFFIDTFEHYTALATEKWIQQVGTVALASDYPKGGLSCLKLTTGAGVGDTGDARLHMGPFPKGRFGIEVDFQNGDTVTNVTLIQFMFLYYDGVNVIAGTARYLAEANLRWQYINAAGAYVDVAGGAQTLDFTAASQPAYHNMKLVVDISEEKYVKLICDEQEFNLSALDLYVAASAVPPLLRVEIIIENAVAGARVLRVDNVILTDQEP